MGISLEEFAARLRAHELHYDPSNVAYFNQANGTNLSKDLAFIGGSVVVDNNTSAYLHFPDAGDGSTGRYVGPGLPAALPLLNPKRIATVRWEAPPGKVQPAAIATEKAQIVFFRAPVPPVNGIPTPVIPPLRWNINSNPAVGVLASATKAAAAGVTHIGDSFIAALIQGTGVAGNDHFSIIDGVSGGTAYLLRSVIGIPATAGSGIVSQMGPGLAYRGTPGNAMTMEFDVLFAAASESVSLAGYDQ